VSETVTESSYNFLLPRFNLVANATDDILLRAGVARDIRRPNFSDLATSVAFGTGSNSVVAIGNPALAPESVWSYDLSAEYYFTPSSLVSVGIFHKNRTNLFTDVQEDPPGNEDAQGRLNIDVTIGNYTYQEQGGSANDFESNFRRIGGNRNIFGNIGVAEPFLRIAQDNLSKNSYNATVFYD